MSNGSTATIPPTPLVVASQLTSPSSELIADKELPPPPPAKSLRRKTVNQPGQEQARGTTELSRNDSLLSPAKSKAPTVSSVEAVEAPPVVKRKALPEPASKKFASLAELGQGPRGGKSGPIPPRKTSVDSQASESNQTHDKQIVEDKHSQPAEEKIPSPPAKENEKEALPLAPPRKVFTGLPSNPRTKTPASPRSPLHLRGKSSTGFNILKVYTHISFPAPVLLR